jgi:glycosyltransferase involved in cell wall biosynthesis
MTVYKDDKPAWFVEAIESVLRQTLKSDDIVVVCDGEVPGELEKILKKYEEQANQ